MSRLGPGILAGDDVPGESAAAIPAATLALVPSYTLAGLPPAGTAGRLADVTNSIGGIHEDTGVQWMQLLADAVNVKDRPFGARGDDLTDNSTALQNAFNAANAVIVPPGTYRFNTGLTIPPSGTTPFVLWCQPGAILKYTATTGNALTIAKTSQQVANGQVLVRGCRLLGPGYTVGGGTASGIRVNDSGFVYLQNLIISDFGSYGLDLAGMLEGSVRDVWITRINTSALRVADGATFATNQLLFSHVLFDNVVRAVDITNGEQLDFNECLVQSASDVTAAVKITAGSQITFEKTWFENNAGASVDVTPGNGQTVSGLSLINNKFNTDSGQVNLTRTGTGQIDRTTIARNRFFGVGTNITHAAGATNTMIWGNNQPGTVSITGGTLVRQDGNTIEVYGQDIQIRRTDGTATALELRGIAGARVWGIVSGQANDGDIAIRDRTGPATRLYLHPTQGGWAMSMPAENAGTAAGSAVLDLQTTTGALLVPRLTTTQRDALSPLNGMIIYNTTTATMQGYIAGAWTNM